MPVKKKIEVPNLASIEALRAPSLADLVKKMPSENRLRGCEVEGMQRGCEVEGKQPFSLRLQIPRNPLNTHQFGITREGCLSAALMQLKARRVLKS